MTTFAAACGSVNTDAVVSLVFYGWVRDRVPSAPRTAPKPIDQRETLREMGTSGLSFLFATFGELSRPSRAPGRSSEARGIVRDRGVKAAHEPWHEKEIERASAISPCRRGWIDDTTAG